MNYKYFVYVLAILTIIAIPQMGIAENENEAIKQFRFAKGLFDKGMLKEAREESEKFVNYYKTSAHYNKGLFLHGEILYRLGEDGESAKYFEEFVKRFPTSELVNDAYYSLGWANYNLKEYNKALKYFRKLENFNDPEIRGDALFRISLIRINQNNFKRAEEILEKLIKQKPPVSTTSEACFTLSKVELAQNKKDEAARTIKYLIRRFPDFPNMNEAYFNIGEISYMEGNYKSALSYYNKGILLSKDTDERLKFTYSIAYSLFELGRYSKAEKAFNRIVTNKTKTDFYTDSLLGLGKSRFHGKKYSRAIEALKKVSGDKSVEASFYIAYAYYKLKKYDDSLKEFSKVKSGELRNKALFYKGIVLFEEKKYKNAISAFEKYLGSGDNEMSDLANFNIAQCHFNNGSYSKSMKILKEIVSKSKDEETLENSIFLQAEIHIIKKEYDEAKRLYLQINGNSSRKSEALIRLGDLLNSVGKTSEALEYYKKFSGDSESGQRASLKAGKIFVEKNEYNEAIKMFEKIKPDNDSVWREAQYELAELKFKTGKSEEAEKILKPLVSKGISYKLKSMNLLSKILIAKNDLEEAEKLIRDIITNSSDNPVIVPAFINYSELCKIQKKYSEGLKNLEKAQEYSRSNEEQAEVLLKMGEMYEKLELEDRAIRSYLKIEILYSKTSFLENGMINLARVYIKKNKKNEAKKILMNLKKKNKGKKMEEVERILGEL